MASKTVIVLSGGGNIVVPTVETKIEEKGVILTPTPGVGNGSGSNSNEQTKIEISARQKDGKEKNLI